MIPLMMMVDDVLVVSENTNELKTRALGRSGLEVSTLGSPAEVGLQRAAETAQTLYLLFIHPRALNLINPRSASAMPE